MSELGVDYSFARPPLDVLVRDGYRFVCRYLATENPETAGKILSGAEVEAIHAAGLSLVLVFEDGAEDALGGGVTGTAHGDVAKAEADALGVPTDVPIYAAVDFDVQSSQFEVVDEYVSSFATATGRPAAVYGPVAYLEHTDVPYRWQAAGWNPTGTDVPGVSIVQRQASSAPPGTDVDVAVAENYGAWNAAPVPAPSPAPKPPEQPAPAPVAPPTPRPSNNGGTVTVNVPVLSQQNPGPNVVSSTVVSVQCLLRQAVSPSLVLDGRFGPITAAAVHDLEVQRGLEVDEGIVGPQVWNCLLGLPIP